MIHTHVTRSARDCDGDYRSGGTDWPTYEEREHPHGDLLFRERIVANMVNTHGYGTLTVTPGAAEWYEQTDEGYLRIHARWCVEDGCPGDMHWQRDLRAEEAGY